MIRLTKAMPERVLPDLMDGGKPVCVQLTPYGIVFRRKGSRERVTLPFGTAHNMACMAAADAKRTRRPTIKRGGF